MSFFTNYHKKVLSNVKNIFTASKKYWQFYLNAYPVLFLLSKCPFTKGRYLSAVKICHVLPRDHVSHPRIEMIVCFQSK